MRTATIRYIGRFLVSAIAGTALTFCLVSSFRLIYVHRSLENAVKYGSVGLADRVARELRLAYVWAPAYPSLQGPVQRLYRAAVSQAGLPFPVPEVPPRSFSASLPLLEKALIPADLLIYAVYKRFGPNHHAPLAEVNNEPAVSRPAAARPEVRHPAGEPANRSTAAMEDSPLPEASSPPAVAEFLPPERPEPLAESVPPERLEPPEVSVPPAEEPPPEVSETSSEPSGAVPARDAVWGVVINPETPVYNQTGTRVRTVPAGSLVDVLRLQTVASGEVVGCSIWSRTGNFQNVILRRSDVELYFGTLLSETTRQQRELASRRAELTVAIEARRQGNTEGETGRNPHQEGYRSLLIEYKAIDDEAGKLKEEFDSASGSRRMELANRLRALKNQQAMLMPRYHDIKQKKEAWEQKDQERRAPADPDSDPEMQQLLQQLDEINEQLRNI